MQSKVYLSEIRKLDIAACKAKADLERAEAAATRTTRLIDGMPHGGRPQDIADRIENIHELRERSIQAELDYINHKLNCIDILAKLENPEYQRVIFKRYVDYEKGRLYVDQYKSIKQIAKEMDYSERQTIRILNAALLAFDEILKAEDGLTGQ